MTDQAETLRLRAGVERARAAVRLASPEDLPAALRRLRDAAAAAGDLDLARWAFEAERSGGAAGVLAAAPADAAEAVAVEPARGPASAPEVHEAWAPAGVRLLGVRIGVNAARAPGARRRVVRRTLERAFEVAAWRETEAGAEAEVRADPTALGRLLAGIPDVTFEIDGADQTSRMTVAA